MDSVIRKVTGRPVVVRGDDIDTDRIMPARYLRCVTFEHIGQYTFQDERFAPDGTPKKHPFNDPVGREATVLIVNKNFGCGSSREHAPQGLLRWGLRALIGESFAEIFAGNCTAIGLPTVTLSAKDLAELMAFAEAHPEQPIDVDLDAREVRYGDRRVAATVKESARKVFLDGSWDSSATLAAALDGVRATADRLPYMRWAVSGKA